MAVSYQIWLRDHHGMMIADLTHLAVKWTWARVLNDVGMFSVYIPDEIDPPELRTMLLEAIDQNKATDQQIEIWRCPVEGMSLKLELKGFARRLISTTDEQGKTWHVLTGVDMMDLLARRAIGYERATGDYIDTTLRWMVWSDLGGGHEEWDSEEEVAAASSRDITLATATAAQGFTFYIQSHTTTATACTTAGRMYIDVSAKNLLAA